MSKEELSKKNELFEDVECVVRKSLESGTEAWEVIYTLNFMAANLGLRFLDDDLGAVTLLLQGANDAISNVIEQRELSSNEKQEKESEASNAKESDEATIVMELPVDRSIH